MSEKTGLRKVVNDLKKRKKELDSFDRKAYKALGKHSAMDRIRLLLDNDSFTETGLFAKSRTEKYGSLKRDGVITGYGTIDGRRVCVYSQDFTQKAGTLGEMHAKKIREVMELATKTGCPIIGIEDSGGARIDEGVSSLDGYAKIFFQNVKASGVVPQISVITGVCAGGAVYSPALTDFIFMVKGRSRMFITGPKVIERVTSEKIDMESLGGARVHAEYSGVAHFEESSEESTFLKVRNLLSYLPSNNIDSLPVAKKKDNASRKVAQISKVVPTDRSKTYDMHSVIRMVFDKESFFEVHEMYAMNIIVGFARLAGITVGVVANQPKVLAGCLDIAASDKAARFVRFCDSFNIPLINLVDVPGYLPGKDQEYGGIIRHGSELLYAYAEATVPKISIVFRKAYGGAYIVLCSKEMHFDSVLAWPTARLAVMGSKEAAEILFRDDPDKARLIKEYKERFLNPYRAAELGAVDRIIDPKDTRAELVSVLKMLASKREACPKRKHGNMPL